MKLKCHKYMSFCSRYIQIKNNVQVSYSEISVHFLFCDVYYRHTYVVKIINILKTLKQQYLYPFKNIKIYFYILIQVCNIIHLIIIFYYFLCILYDISLKLYYDLLIIIKLHNISNVYLSII